MIIVCLSGTGMKLIERVGACSEEIYAKLSRRVGEARTSDAGNQSADVISSPPRTWRRRGGDPSG
jgi:hypothetical protein